MLPVYYRFVVYAFTDQCMLQNISLENMFVCLFDKFWILIGLTGGQPASGLLNEFWSAQFVSKLSWPSQSAQALNPLEHVWL